jgi:hypothetical protein
MSTLPAPYAAALSPAPQLATAPEQALLDLFGDMLPWLSDRYGLVQAVARTAGTKTERVPQV